MNYPLKFSPDHWLLCSPALADGIAPWIAEAGERSLGALRLRTGMVETVALGNVLNRIDKLHATGHAGAIHVVFGASGDDERAVRRQLASRHERPVLLYNWKAQAQDVVASLSSPEPAVSAAWMKHHEVPTTLQVNAEVPAHWLEEYRAGLTVWAEAVQHEHPWGLGSRIVNSPIFCSVTDLLQVLGESVAIAADTAVSVASDVPRFARMVASSIGISSARAMPGLATGAANSDPSAKDLVLEWKPGNGTSLTVTADEGATDALVSLILESPIAKVRRITRVEVMIGDEVIDLANGADKVSWSELENNYSLAVAQVPLTESLKRQISAPEVDIELSFMFR